MDSTTAHTLEVPGAHLHYDVRGSGPVLLMIPGGWSDTGEFTGLAPRLASEYTVITYDPRGLSRSTVDDAVADISVDVQAEDTHHLLAAVTTEPAYVLGVSGGAVTGLALTGRYPAQVRTLVAHEPPVPEVLPDREQIRAWVDDVCDTFRSEGPVPAMQAFVAGAGLDNEENLEEAATPDPEMLASFFGQTLDQMTRNLSLFFGRMFRPTAHYRPDLAALRATSSRVVVAAGTASAGQLAHRSAVALADLLGTPIVDFPGDHGAYLSSPDEFATVLRRVLTGRE